MCGRFSSSPQLSFRLERFRAEPSGVEDHRPSFNVAPASDILVVVAGNDGARQLRELRWGLVPRWAKDPKAGNRMINMRAETVREKPTWQRTLARNRCIIPIDGFYEWQAQDAVRDEVGVRLRVTTTMAASLLAEQLGGFVTLVEAEARRPRLVRAVAAGDPSRFDGREIGRELAALIASRDGLGGTGLFDLDGVLRNSPVAPELVGKDFSGRDYYQGLVATGIPTCPR